VEVAVLGIEFEPLCASTRVIGNAEVGTFGPSKSGEQPRERPAGDPIFDPVAHF